MDRYVSIIFLLGATLHLAAAPQRGQAERELTVHISQANAHSGYAFVRAKFYPGEVGSPWAVRFFDKDGKEIPYFVWEAVDWQTAQWGRMDWGKQYALLQHFPGNDYEAKNARAEKLAWAKAHMPEEAAEMERYEQAAQKFPHSQCLVLYLLRYRCAPYAKEKLTMKIDPKRRVNVQRQQFKNEAQDVTVGDLVLQGFPLNPTVIWKGKPLFRYAGFKAGEVESANSHADPARGYSWTLERGIITKLRLLGKTEGRMGGEMNWDCSYWLFPEGGYVALEGFSLTKPEGYLGGSQQPSILEASVPVQQLSTATWQHPWFVQQIGDAGFAAIHPFPNAPLTVGYDNNPFLVGVEKQRPWVGVEGSRLLPTWNFQLSDVGVLRMFAPRLYYGVEGYNRSPAAQWLCENLGGLLRGEVKSMPPGMDTQRRSWFDGQLQLLRWKPNIDWLYRQYAVGVGESRESAEQAVAHLVCAAGGWIDRPWSEARLARLIVDVVSKWGEAAVGEGDAYWESWHVPLLLGHILKSPQFVRSSLQFVQPRGIVWSREALEKVKAQGQDPLQGFDHETVWANPGYHSSWVPNEALLLDYFDVPYNREQYRKALVEWADYVLETCGGTPFSWERYQQAYQSFWPNRTVLIVPTLLYAHRVTGEQRYGQAAKMMFDDIHTLMHTNPLGYFHAWTYRPRQGAYDYDTVYIGAAIERGLLDFYRQNQLNVIGREKMSQMVTALSRWTVVGHTLADNGETDNFTATATHHGAHPQLRVHAFLFLHDDFDFYKGLVGEMLRWGVMAPERTNWIGFRWISQARDFWRRGADAPIIIPLMWALGIHAGEQPNQSSFGRLPDGWRASLKNALPGGRTVLSLRAGDVQPELFNTNRPLGESLLWRVSITEPTYRTWATVEVRSKPEQETIRVTHRTVVFFAYSRTHPDWSDTKHLEVVRIGEGGKEQPIPFALRDGSVAFTAEAGEYVIRVTRVRW